MTLKKKLEALRKAKSAIVDKYKNECKENEKLSNEFLLEQLMKIPDEEQWEQKCKELADLTVAYSALQEEKVHFVKIVEGMRAALDTFNKVIAR